MLDLAWISKEAVQIHAYFESLFYVIVTLFLVIGVLIEYFRLPLGITPSVGSLVGRAFIAAILLHTYPEISSLIADVTDGVSKHLGEFNQFKLVLDRMGERLHEFSWSWISVKGSLMMAISFLAFFLLYFTVHVAQAFLLYTWTLLYVFSPVLIALFVLPQTAGATSALYRSLIEASLWKIVWAVLATLLWSTGVSDVAQHASLLSSICFNLILAGSVVLTPFVVHALAGKGVSSMNGTFGSVAVGGLAAFTPTAVVGAGAVAGKKMYNRTLNTADSLTRKHFPRTNKMVKATPRFRVPEKPPVFEQKDKEKKK
jgi:hypothetical protein